MNLKENIINLFKEISFADIYGMDESNSTNKLIEILRNKGFSADNPKIPLRFDIFRWSPEFDDIIINDPSENHYTIWIEVKVLELKGNRGGFYYFHGLTQTCICEHYMRENAINGEVLLLLICNFTKTDLNDEEKYMATRLGISEDNIIIVGKV